ERTGFARLFPPSVGRGLDPAVQRRPFKGRAAPLPALLNRPLQFFSYYNSIEASSTEKRTPYDPRPEYRQLQHHVRLLHAGRQADVFLAAVCGRRPEQRRAAVQDGEY